MCGSGSSDVGVGVGGRERGGCTREFGGRAHWHSGHGPIILDHLHSEVVQLASQSGSHLC